MSQFAHKLIAKTAEVMAATAYEELARDNKFFKAWPNQARFAKAHIKAYTKAARTVLASMLGKDFPNMSKEEETTMKDEIAEALFADFALPAGGKVSASPSLLH